MRVGLGLGLDILTCGVFYWIFYVFYWECLICCFALPCTPRVLLVGGFAISAFILSSISFVHTARLDGSSRAPFAAFSLCRHFGFSSAFTLSAAACL
jgi:hypothetical protein